jgi:hypothetical protein
MAEAAPPVKLGGGDGDLDSPVTYPDLWMLEKTLCRKMMIENQLLEPASWRLFAHPDRSL